MTKKLIILLGLTILVLTSMAVTANAQVLDPSYRPINIPVLGTEGMDDLSGVARVTILLLQTISGGLLFFAAPIAVIMITVSALRMVVGSHESEKIEQAKKHLTWSIIGLLVIMLSYSIVRIVIRLVILAAS